MQKFKILFIINPISGTKKKTNMVQKIYKYLNKDFFDYQIIFTERPKHAIEIARENSKTFDIICAVGGDGSVNEVAKGIKGTDTILAIIPIGSGNGFASNINIPINTTKAIKLINNFAKTNNYLKIDTIDFISETKEDKQFVHIAGLGFEAEISNTFAKRKFRGILSYLWLVIRKFAFYKEQSYTLKFNDKELKINAFSISFANSAQYAHNIYIAPKAKINDGLLDICILKKFPIYYTPILLLHFLNRTIYKSKYYEFYQTDRLELIVKKEEIAHIDAEPVKISKFSIIKVNKEAMKIIVF